MRLRPLCGLGLASVLLSGCASTVGEREYACEGMPSRPLCLSMSEIYTLTNGAGPLPAELPRNEDR
jgi:hypothetical protein